METSRHKTRIHDRSAWFRGAIVVILLTVGALGCSTPMGQPGRGGLFSDPDQQPRRAETMTDFVGLERPQ